MIVTDILFLLSVAFAVSAMLGPCEEMSQILGKVYFKSLSIIYVILRNRSGESHSATDIFFKQEMKSVSQIGHMYRL